MLTFLQRAPYLRNQRQFPEDNLKQLSQQLDQAYIDIASKVNARTIGIFGNNFPTLTGERWYLQGGDRTQQTIREVYAFVAADLPITHNIPNSPDFVKIYGTFTDGTNWYPLPYVDVVAANNQVNVYVTPTQIVITGGGGGGQPTIVSGYVILEFLSNIDTNS